MAATLVHEQAARLDMEGCRMSGDDDDYLEDIVITVISVFTFLLFVAAIGSIVWALIS